MNHTKMPNLLITILIVLFICKPFVALGGGWKPIPDVTDPTVVGIGKFAVDEHNKEDSASLKFSKVVKGETQLAAGRNYNLTVTAVDGSTENNYVALVWDNPWAKIRKLVSFKGPFDAKA